MDKPYQKFRFKNGMRLVTVPMKNTQAVTVLVLVGTGSKYETKEINGISHFLEHMFFKGTKKRPNTLAIAETLDKVGGEYNAFTDKEDTGYWAKTDSGHIDLAFDWVSDVFLNSKLEPQEIEKEKGVIIEEINMYLDTPMFYIEDLWEKLLYGDQPAGWGIAGNKNVIAKIKREQFINYMQSHYLAKNTVIVVAGNIKENKRTKTKIEHYFKDIKIGKAKSKKKTIEIQKKPEVLVHYKKTDQTHLHLGVRGYDVFDSRKYALTLLGTILGGNMSSRLWISVREKEGMAYYITTSSHAYTDSGYLVTKAGIDNNRVEKATEIILKEYRRITEEKVGENELRKAKDYLKGKSILNMEESNAQATFYGAQELTENRILTLDEIFAKIEAVTADDILRAAKDIFRSEKLNLALIGPFKDKTKFEKLLKL